MVNHFNFGVNRGFKLNEYKLIKETIVEGQALEEKPIEGEPKESDETTGNANKDKSEPEIDMLVAHERLGRFIIYSKDILDKGRLGNSPFQRSNRTDISEDENNTGNTNTSNQTGGTGKAGGADISADGNRNNTYKVVNSVNDKIPDECNKVVNGVEIENYINEFKVQLADYLKSKYNYSDDFIDSILNFIIEKALYENQLTNTNFDGMGVILEKKDKTYNVKTVLESMKNNTLELMSKYYMGIGRIDEKPSDIKITPDSFGDRLGNIQQEWLSNILKTLYRDFDVNYEDIGSFNSMIMKRLGLETYADFAKLDKNGDGTWVDEFYEFVETELKNIKTFDENTINNAKTLDLDSLFNGKSSLTAEDIMNNYGLYTWSDDPGVREFVKLLKEKFEEFKNNSQSIGSFDEEYFLRSVITLLNKRNGIKGDGSDILKSGTLKSHNTLSRLNAILNSQELYNMMLIPIDGVIDDFKQGKEGDCWLLSGLIAFNSSQYGKDYIKNAIKWNDDHTAVSVKFNDRTIYLTIDEIMQFYKEDLHAVGDIDVLVIEAAFKKQIGEINRDSLKTFLKYFGGKPVKDRFEFASGLDDLFSLIGSLFGGDGKCDLHDYNVIKYLQSVLDNMQSGNYSAYSVTFTLYSAGYASYSWTTIDGKTYTIEKDDKFSHALAITNITEDTVTFVNPWHPEQPYTVTWEEFANIGIAQFSVSYFK